MVGDDLEGRVNSWSVISDQLSEMKQGINLRPVIAFALICVALAVLWESIKLIFKVSDVKLPHLTTIAMAFVNPFRRGGLPVWWVLTQNAIVTMRGAISGFVVGALFGFFLGAALAHSPLLERGLVPYVVASQTVPILAIAPMLVIWLNNAYATVAILAAYLTFFPVTINTLRGLKSPDPHALELMRSYAANKWETLWKLRFPSALPYIFTALKISATASVVGAIVGELPSSESGGLGRAILTANQYSATSPENLWAAIIITALVGILFFIVVSVAERVALRNIVRVI